MGGSLAPPWFHEQRTLGLKLARKALRKKHGKAPLPQSKAEQRAIAEALASLPATHVPTGKRALPPPFKLMLR